MPPDWKLVARRLVTCLAVGASLTSGSRAVAHGAMEAPASRTFACRFLEMDDPMCQLAWAAESQALYDWMEVNRAAVAGRHREEIPDGTLCAGGREKYAVFDTPGPWPATAIVRAADGLYPVTFYATAPHEAQYFRFYLTREGFDPLTERLDWDDLELVYDSGAVSVQELTAEPHYTFRLPLPPRADRAILYLVWQRSDSPEAFYGCSDVLLGSAEAPVPEPDDPPSAPDPNPGEPPPPPPSLPGPGLDDLTIAVDLHDDWGTGACGEALVTHGGTDNVVWEVNLEVPGTLTHLWDAELHDSMHPHHPDSALPHPLRVIGAPWNRTLAPGTSTPFGFCFDRTGEPGPTEPAPPEEPTEEPAGVSVAVSGTLWWNGFTAELSIQNPSALDLEAWEFRFRSSHAVVGQPWGTSIDSLPLAGGLYEHTLRGVGWAQRIPAGGTVRVGFNGRQGTPLGNAGTLTANQLFDGESPSD